MFGVNLNISDGSLYILSDIVEDLLNKTLQELESTNKEETEKIKQLQLKIDHYSSELENFKKSIENQLNEKFQFSIEELYSMYGQYDKYISIEFHKYSESAKKFGSNIGGVIIYQKSEREQLESILSQNDIPRTNSFVKFDANMPENLSKELIKDLQENGFKSGDIYEILTTDLPKIKAYNQSGKKDIPNTLTVNFNPTDFDPNRAYLWLYNQKIKNGEQLIDEEWAKFCGISIFFNPEAINVDIIKDKSLNQDGTLNHKVRFYELEAKLYARKISREEIFEFEKLLSDRRINRTEAIKYEIKRSTNKSLEKFEEEYPVIYDNLQKSIVEFEEENLYYWNMHTPIYWDYEGYLHIYLRHCDELNIEGHFENKTKFQYTQKDIKRILKIAIEKLAPQINERLQQGKDYRLYGDKSLYFNGNHYSLHILSNGRVAAFHPIDNPDQ